LSESRVVPCGQTEGQTDMTKLIVAFRNFANAPKIPGLTWLPPYPPLIPHRWIWDRIRLSAVKGHGTFQVNSNPDSYTKV